MNRQRSFHQGRVSAFTQVASELAQSRNSPPNTSPVASSQRSRPRVRMRITPSSTAADSAHSGFVNWCGVVISPSCDSVTSSYAARRHDRSAGQSTGSPPALASEPRICGSASRPAITPTARMTSGSELSSRGRPAQRCTIAGSTNNIAENRMAGFRQISPTSAAANTTAARDVSRQPGASSRSSSNTTASGSSAAPVANGSSGPRQSMS